MSKYGNNLPNSIHIETTCLSSALQELVNAILYLNSLCGKSKGETKFQAFSVFFRSPELQNRLNGKKNTFYIRCHYGASGSEGMLDISADNLNKLERMEIPRWFYPQTFLLYNITALARYS